ncbi:MAG: hypothetical protein V4565_11750 [Bacteroidota bacterium]
MSEINLPYATIIYKDPIVYLTYEADVELGFPEIRELISCAEKVSGNKPYFTLSDIRTGVNITNEGKRIVSDINNMPYLKGTAALVKNSFYKFAIEFINTFQRSPYPFHAFTEKQEAIDWLLSLSLENTFVSKERLIK